MTVNRILLTCVLTVLAYASSSLPARAENGNAPAPSPAISSRSEAAPGSEEMNKPKSDAADPPSPVATDYKYLSSPEFYLVVVVALIGLIALGLQFILLGRIKNLKAEDMLRVFAVTLVLIGTLFFVTVGFGTDQIAPAIGLFGTIAGYLLGRSANEGGKKNDEKDTQ